MPTTLDRESCIVNSAVWAAFGDALGFISEGVDERGLARRLEGDVLDTKPWIRKVSRVSPDILLPAGLYSDDTQLRLATSRAIRKDGHFDVEAFSSVELPSWLEYHLGAGLGTLSSARRLRSHRPWNTLVTGDKDGRYVNGGGNGAAMRIQPHVWSARRGDDDRFLLDVIHNTACTHGHPKAFVGSLFHAVLLRWMLDNAQVPDTNLVLDLVDVVQAALSRVGSSKFLGSSWIEQWNRSAAASFDKEWTLACDSVRGCIKAIPSIRAGDSGRYTQYLGSLNLLSESERGVATKTAAAAYAALKILDGLPPVEILRIIAGALASDTDSIATMAGALLGVCFSEKCSSAVLDRQYVEDEARRNVQVAAGTDAAAEFDYHVRRDKTGLKVGSLAYALPVSERIGRPGAKEHYQWVRMPFGQTILLRVSPEERKEPSLFDVGVPGKPNGDEQKPIADRRVDPKDIAASLAESNFDPQKIGKYLLNCARYPFAEGLASAIAYELMKLYKQRLAAQHTPGRENRPIRDDSRTLKKNAEPEVPPAALQLQLSASPSAEGSQVQGTIANYGRRPATDVTVIIGQNGSALRITFDELSPDDSRSIQQSATFPIKESTPVTVEFSSAGTTLSQRGEFEQAAGNKSMLLLKGLGLAEQR